MADVDIINEIWKTLTDDTELLALLGLPANATIAQKATKVQKELEPNGLSTSNIPLICIYPLPGSIDSGNDFVYDVMPQLDIYASSLFTAMTIGKKVRSILNSKDLPVLDASTFSIWFVSSAAAEAKVSGIKKYTMRFEISEVIE